MKKTAQIFLMIGIITRLIFAAPLAAIGIFEYVALTEAKKKSDIGKVLLALTLIFVSPVAGIIILCMKDGHFEKKGFSVGKVILSAIAIIIALLLLLILIYAVSIYYHYTSPVEVTAEKKEIIAMLEKEYGKPRFASAWNYADYTYTDPAGNIVKGDTREDGMAGFFFDDNYFEVVGITENTLLLFEWEDNVNSIYRSDHEMKNVEKVYEFESKYHICEFLSEELVRFKLEPYEYIIYNIRTGESIEDGEELFFESSYHKYSCGARGNFDEELKSVITEISSGRERELTFSEEKAFISENCDVAKTLVEAGRVYSYGFRAHGENAYFFCNTTDGITIVYEYDFEEHTCEYISFIDKEQLPKTMAFYPEYYFAEKD
jgi:hypothetical protein